MAIASFKATLEETVLADLIVHVVDASEPEERRRESIAAVDSVLQEIGAAMRISRERVRQIEMQALRKLKFAAKRRGLFTYISD